MHARNRTWLLGSDPVERCRQRTLPVEGGDGSTLSLDFTTGVLDPRLSFTRSTTATYINSEGYVTTMAAAPTNDPTKARFDYDPTTLQPRGLLIEGTSNNLLNWSESFASSGGTNNNWGDSSISRTTGQTDPANGTTAIRFTASAGNATVISSAAIGTSAQRTFSIWLRRVTGTGNIQFTTDNGTTWTTQAITSSWVRYTFPATTAAQRVGIRIVTSADAIEMWGAMLEDGSGSSSYIPTGASQGSRALDLCYIAGANFTSWFSTGAGTVVAQSDNVCTVGQNTLCSFTDNTINNYIRMGDGTGGGSNELLLTVVGGSNQGIVDSLFNPALNTAYKTAYAWDTNNFAICANGGSVATDTGGTLAGAGVITSVTIGGDFYQISGPNSVNMKNGHIRSWKYYPTRLSNAQLQALTT